MNPLRYVRTHAFRGLCAALLGLVFLASARGLEPAVIKMEPMVITDRTVANDEDWPVGELRMIATPETDNRLPVRRVSDKVFFIGWRKSDITGSEGLAGEVMELANQFSDCAPEVTAILIRILPNFVPSQAVPVSVSVASNSKTISSNFSAQTGVILLFRPVFQH